MRRSQKSQAVPASAENCYRAMPEVFRQMGIDVLSADGDRIRGCCNRKQQGKFTIEVVCRPSGENTAEITLFLTKWNARLDVNETRDLIFIALRRVLGFSGVAIDINQVSGEALYIFPVCGGRRREAQWVAMLTESAAVFFNPVNERTLIVPRDKAWEQTKTGDGAVLNIEGDYIFTGKNKKLLLKWFPPKPKAAIRKELCGEAIGLLFLGMGSIWLPEHFSPVILLSERFRLLWGIVWIAAGIASLCIAHRIMFAVDGTLLVAAGVLNMVGAISIMTAYYSAPILFVFGSVQFSWGIQEMRKCWIYRGSGGRREGL